MAVEGQRNAKNTALIPSDITLMDSKLGVISIGDWPPLNPIGVPPSLDLCPMAENNIDLLIDKKRREYKLFIELPNPNS
ncbi:hypothetical protein GW17_00055909 [Ensete ventricosum]|nr:hypothetical protein GW17_00055909 [Ensete ventricosum]